MNEASEGVFSLLAFFGRSGLRPSLVRGDSPRNAPLQNQRSPKLRRNPSSAARPTRRRPAKYTIR